ncbi:MAG: ribbon-helix-helix protein, CopG family [Magnetococcales bacterium]|nr:ribbon-helix-helix protein, CopG family [Magnetococcales bacterium]MBF0114975.1 ribbon-helix-helix protein, CopG family [Magnetococcales bacterium]
MTIAIPADMEEMFQFVAKETGRPLEELIREALDRFLEEWEERQDAMDADRAYREFKESGEKGIPWEVVKAEMDARHAL